MCPGCVQERHTYRENRISKRMEPITDHEVKEILVVDWDNIRIVDTDSMKTRKIREAICIRTEEHPMNRDERAPAESFV